MKKKIIRTAAIPMSLSGLLKGQLSFLSQYYEVIGLASNDIEALGNLRKQEGIKTIAVNISRDINLLNDLKSLWDLYIVFKREKPDLVHSITPKAGLLSMIAAKLAGVPIRIHTFTGLIFPTKRGFLKHVLISMDKILCFCATKIFPEGNGVKKTLIEYKITRKPLKVLANGNVNGIDLKFYNAQLFDTEHNKRLKSKLNIHPKDFVFIFLGRLVGDKGINELISAFHELCKTNSTVKLLLVGDYETELDPLREETLKIMEMNPNIINTGWVDDVRPYLAISDCLVFPSYREGFPNVVMQAGAMGLPAIVTDINGCNEIIVEGKNGTIIPVKDTEAIFAKMQQFLNKELQYDSEMCRSLITERYERQVVWDALLKEYQELLSLNP